MKKTLMALAVGVMSLTAMAQDEWVGIGTGAYQPGILDFYDDEFSLQMPAAVYESSTTPGKYKFVPDPGFEGTVPGTSPVVVYDIIVHAENPDRVWCEDATFFRGIMNLTARHKVKETSAWDVEANYGKLVDGVISFSTPNSFQVIDMMGPKDSNKQGKFALYLPGNAPGQDPIVNDTWQSIGMGKYVEGLLDCEYEAGVMWDVEIEESAEHPGCYRLKPYFEGNPSCPNLPEVADTYIYIHADMADNVYTTDFTLLNNAGRGYKICHRAADEENPDDDAYGKLENGVITFPADSHTATVIGVAGAGTVPTNISGKACIILPGADWKDYSLTVTHPMCATDAGPGFCKFPFRIDASENVASVMVVVEAGYRTEKDLDFESYLSTGTEFPAMFFGFDLNMNFPLAADQFNTNRWTLIAVALDAHHKMVNSSITTFFTPENDNDWEEYGEGEFTDLLAGSYYGEDVSTYTVKIERNKKNEGLLRIVNPYAEHPQFEMRQDCGDHNHYIYLDVTDPSYVYVIESALGLDLGYGEMVASSQVGNLLNRGKTLAEIKAEGVPAGLFNGDEIRFEPNALCIFETGYQSMSLQPCAGGLMLKITSSSVDRIDSDLNEGPTEYYDLRGIRITNPHPGQLYIKKQGSTVTKEVK